MSAPELPVPLSAVALRLTDEVGQIVLDWVAAGDLSLSAALDQHVAAVRAELAICQPNEPSAARLAGQAAHTSRPRAAGTGTVRPQRARKSAAVRSESSRVAKAGPAVAACPDAPFADSAWHADAALPVRLLLHYACGFIEAAVRAEWWPSELANDPADFEAMRLAAVCRLVRQAAAAAALPPDLR